MISRALLEQEGQTGRRTAVGLGKLGASYGDEADFCVSELKMSGERGELHFFFITAYQQ